MPKSTRIAVFVLGLTVATPAWASAQQAVPRNGGSSSSSSSGSSGSSSSSSSSGGDTTSSGSSSSSSSSRSNDAPPPAPSRTAPPGSTYVGSAATRSSSPAPAPSRTGSGGSSASGAANGSAVSRGSSDNSRVSGGAAASSAFNYNNNYNTTVANPGARDRNGRPIVGTATARPELPLGSGGSVFSPFGRWIPFYGPGFGYNLGFVTYNPWYYGSTRWIYGRYGLWYDPYLFYPYDPFYYPGYYGGSSYYGGYSGSTSSYEKESAPPKSVVGAVRIKANESKAKVYVDGVLMGSVSDFDGLSHHLELEAGGHQLELRADGYQAVTKDINVESGKTTTERLTLKKK